MELLVNSGDALPGTASLRYSTRPPGLSLVNEGTNSWQKMTGSMRAEVWCRSENPPLDAEKSAVYATAFLHAQGETRNRLARCLTLCDAGTTRYCPSRREGYKAAFLAYPQDEVIAFFVATLCYHHVLTDAALALLAYEQLLVDYWATSPYWKRYQLRREEIFGELMLLYNQDPELVTPDRVQLAEKAFSMSLLPTAWEAAAAYLARIYRNSGREDSATERAHWAVFAAQRDDAENHIYLARMYQRKQRTDAQAAAVYAWMSHYCEQNGNLQEAGQWLLRLARAYLSQKRADAETFPIYRKAHTLAPDDRVLEAGFLLSLLVGDVTPMTRQCLLEDALEREAELGPAFATQGWDINLLWHALAGLYARQQQNDTMALSVYTRVAQLPYKDRSWVPAYAAALAENEIYTEEAGQIYEEAIQRLDPSPVPVAEVPGADLSHKLALARCHELEKALAHTYIATNAIAGEKRPAARALFEKLLKDNHVWAGLIEALTRAYLQEPEAHNLALSLLTRAAEADETNGPIRFRLAQEWERRQQWEKAAFYYRAAARLLPDDFSTQYHAASLLFHHFQDAVGSLPLLQRAVQLPEGARHRDAHYLLGLAFQQRNQFSEARAAFEKIVQELQPGDGEAQQRLEELSALMQANAFLTEEPPTSTRLAEETRPTCREQGQHYFEDGDWEKALPLLEQSVTVDSPDATVYRQLALIYERRGDLPQAENVLRQIIALGVANKEIYTLLGKIVLKKGTLTHV